MEHQVLAIAAVITIAATFATSSNLAQANTPARSTSGCPAAPPADETGTSTKALTVASLIARHVAARGGADALAARQRMEVWIQITEPSFEVRGHYRATRDGRMRIDVYQGDERVYSEGLTGGRADPRGHVDPGSRAEPIGHGDALAWQQPQGATRATPASDQGAAALRRGIYQHLYGLHEYAALGIDVRYAGPETVDGVRYERLDVRFPDGHEQRDYLNPCNWLIERTHDVHALHPDADPEAESLERTYSDWVEVAGVVYPNLMVMREARSGEERQRVRVLERIVDGHLPADTFQPPGLTDR